MDDTGKQLHPNLCALATLNIPLKRFIREGSKENPKAKRNSRGKYETSQVTGNEIKAFYEELITKQDNKVNQNLLNGIQNKITTKTLIPKIPIAKTEFKVRNYFRYAMENKVDELKRIDFEDQNINVFDDYGWTALMMASCEGSYEAVEFLLSIGVDRHIKEKTGKTATDFAHRKGYLRIVDLLENNPEKLAGDACEKLRKAHNSLCVEKLFKETSKSQHYIPTTQKLHTKSNLPISNLQKFNISSRNKGLQLMIKQGWDKESGLGPKKSGRLYPIKTVMRKQRTGLGIEQEAPRVTHYQSVSKKKTRNRHDIKKEKLREWKRERRLRNELN